MQDDGHNTPLPRRILVTLGWCWGSAFVSMFVMADSGGVAQAGLPGAILLSLAGVFAGPLFVAPGLLENGGSHEACLWLGVLFYGIYAALLWSAIASRISSIRYAALSVITLGSFIAWNGLRHAI